MKILCNSFRDMPYLLKILTLLLLIAPVLAAGSVVSETVILSGVDKSNLHQSSIGAAKNLFELMLIFAVALIGPVVAFIALMRRKIAVVLMPVALLLISAFSPFILTIVRENYELYFRESLASCVVAAIVLAYMCFSKSVQSYFEKYKIKPIE